MKTMIELHRPVSLRRELATEIDRARSRQDRLGELMVPALEQLEAKLPAESKPLFDLGRIYVSLSFRQPDKGFMVPDRSFDEILDRHQAGDFGDFGTAANLPESDDVRWCVGAFGPQGVQAMSLRNNLGPMMSVHRLDYEPGRVSLDVTIVTRLAGDAASTFIIPAREFRPTQADTWTEGAADSTPAVETSGPPRQRLTYAGSMMLSR